MGDVGDYWRDVKEHKKALRNHWHECPKCRVRFGTGTLVAPGRRCRHDGWQAPGEIGDDQKAAEADYRAQQKQEFEKVKARKKRQRERLTRTCPHCKAVLRDVARKEKHVAKVHGDAAWSTTAP